MILLDTNIVSSLLQIEPNTRVVTWLNGVEPGRVWTTSITVFEVEKGLGAMAPGRRRTALWSSRLETLHVDLGGRVAPFDAQAATAAAFLIADRRARGITVDICDTQIAGIAISRNATLVTRNRRHFDDLATPVVDPWTDTH